MFSRPQAAFQSSTLHLGGNDMKIRLVPTIISALAMAGAASAGMQGQGARPDTTKREYKEEKPGGYRIDELDKDVDTTISKQEARVKRHLFEHFNKIDKNGDGKLDKAELSAFQG
jgi:hypothetical protein